MNSKIILVKNINLDKNYSNVVNYSEEEMLSLCTKNAIAIADNYSFLRPTDNIYTNFTYEQCLQATYLAFQNTDYSNKWFFAFIDNVIYRSDKNTEISYTVDSWSTWYSYWEPKMCYVEREHVSNDTIGLHTINENLDVGEVIAKSSEKDDAYSNQFGYWIVMLSDWKIADGSTGGGGDKGEQSSGISVHDNVVYGNQVLLFNINSSNNYRGFLDLQFYILRTLADGHFADIKNIFITCNLGIDFANLTSHTAYVIEDKNEFTFYTLTSYDTKPQTFTSVIEKSYDMIGYSPKNNKCLCYPYNYLYVTNNQGSHNIYKYEDFGDDECMFENQFALTVGGSGKLVPINYKGIDMNYDESLPLGKLPTCAWSGDAYVNWLTQNAINMPVKMGTLVGDLTLNPNPIKKVGDALSLAQTVGDSIGGFYAASLAPNLEGGQATGDISWASDSIHYKFSFMQTKPEYMKIIDDYFTRFGYKVNSLSIPNITGRKYWNYIEIGANEEIGYGNVPRPHMEIINNICRKGVTIWHNHDNIGDYTLDNEIIG